MPAQWVMVCLQWAASDKTCLFRPPGLDFLVSTDEPPASPASGGGAATTAWGDRAWLLEVMSKTPPPPPPRSYGASVVRTRARARRGVLATMTDRRSTRRAPPSPHPPCRFAAAMAGGPPSSLPTICDKGAEERGGSAQIATIGASHRVFVFLSSPPRGAPRLRLTRRPLPRRARAMGRGGALDRPARRSIRGPTLSRRARGCAA